MLPIFKLKLVRWDRLVVGWEWIEDRIGLKSGVRAEVGHEGYTIYFRLDNRSNLSAVQYLTFTVSNPVGVHLLSLGILNQWVLDLSYYSSINPQGYWILVRNDDILSTSSGLCRSCEIEIERELAQVIKRPVLWRPLEHPDQLINPSKCLTITWSSIEITQLTSVNHQLISFTSPSPQHTNRGIGNRHRLTHPPWCAASMSGSVLPIYSPVSSQTLLKTTFILLRPSSVHWLIIHCVPIRSYPVIGTYDLHIYADCR